ncbi:MAG: hypothetical protein OXB99_16135 [Acidimicrobiaceae bacterium]|nr:hypothetical protein [Acidimicrobiaceae bacterium]
MLRVGRMECHPQVCESSGLTEFQGVDVVSLDIGPLQKDHVVGCTAKLCGCGVAEVLADAEMSRKHAPSTVGTCGSRWRSVGNHPSRPTRIDRSLRCIAANSKRAPSTPILSRFAPVRVGENVPGISPNSRPAALSDSEVMCRGLASSPCAAKGHRRWQRPHG